jgi:hypothetical protein
LPGAPASEPAKPEVALPSPSPKPSALQQHPATVPFTRTEAPAPAGELPAPKILDPGVDVAGFKLGMSVDDALTALNPRASEEYAQLNYSWVTLDDKFDRTEGRSNRREDIAPLSPGRHVSGISFSRGRDPVAERIALTFALPPEPNVVIDIVRSTNHINMDKNRVYKPEVTEAAFVSALKEKYGPEPEVWNQQSGLNTGSGVWGNQLYKWSYPGPGKGDCKPFIKSAGPPNVWDAPSTHAAVAKQFGYAYPSPHECATTLLAVIQPPSSPEWRALGYVEKAETRLANEGAVYLNRKRHEAWAKKMKADWVEKTRSQIQSAKPTL